MQPDLYEWIILFVEGSCSDLTRKNESCDVASPVIELGIEERLRMNEEEKAFLET